MYIQSFNLTKLYNSPNDLGSTLPTFFLSIQIPLQFIKNLKSVKLVVTYHVFNDFALPANSWFKFDQSLSVKFTIPEAELGNNVIQPNSADFTNFNNQINNQIVYNPDFVVGQPNGQMYVTAEQELMNVTFEQRTKSPIYDVGIDGLLNRVPDLTLTGSASNFSTNGTIALTNIKMLYKAQVIVEATS